MSDLEGTSPWSRRSARLRHLPSTRLDRRGFGRTANVLLAYTLAKGLQLSLYALIFPLYLYHLGYKQDTIGLVTALGAMTTLVGAVPLGLLADRVGRARLFVFSALLTPIPYLAICRHIVTADHHRGRDDRERPRDGLLEHERAAARRRGAARRIACASSRRTRSC